MVGADAFDHAFHQPAGRARTLQGHRRFDVWNGHPVAMAVIVGEGGQAVFDQFETMGLHVVDYGIGSIWHAASQNGNSNRIASLILDR
jgi:hypothetical protein